MKTLKRVPVELICIPDNEFIPDSLEFGKIYYSIEYKISVHLCLCGCNVKCALPIKEGEWNLKIEDSKPTISPSIQQLFECRSHYIITKGIANFV